MSHDSSEEERNTRPLPGVITSISIQKKNTRRCSIFLDGDYAFGVHQDVLLEHALHTGLHLDEERIDALIRADAFMRAKEAALSFLGYRARTEFEVRRKLGRKGFTDEIVDRVIDRLRTLSYIDDAQFARDFIRDRFASKGYGPQRLRAELLRIGVDAGLVEEMLSERFDDSDLLEVAVGLATKRWERLTSEPDLTKKRSKLYGFLLRRGYSPEIARAAMKKVSDDRASD